MANDHQDRTTPLVGTPTAPEHKPAPATAPRMEASHGGVVVVVTEGGMFIVDGRIVGPDHPEPAEPPPCAVERASGGLTYGDLKDALSKFTPEQLAMPVMWTGDERGGPVRAVWIAEEDWILTEDGDVEAFSVVAESYPEEAAAARVAIKRGTPHLQVD